MGRKHKQIDWWVLTLKVIVVIYAVVLGWEAIKYLSTAQDTEPERVSTEMIDDDKYLITYKQRVDRKTIYTSMIVDKEGNQ